MDRFISYTLIGGYLSLCEGGECSCIISYVYLFVFFEKGAFVSFEKARSLPSTTRRYDTKHPLVGNNRPKRSIVVKSGQIWSLTPLDIALSCLT